MCTACRATLKIEKRIFRGAAFRGIKFLKVTKYIRIELRGQFRSERAIVLHKLWRKRTNALQTKLPAELNSDIFGDVQIVRLSKGMTPTTVQK